MLATNWSWTDRDGEAQERTEWHRVVARLNLVEANAKRLTINPEELVRPIPKP